ncbi:MAG: ROK family protein [Acidimicrobiales bacterium]|nr:ROK family protein [Acidimicrobiales bacterium]
MADCLAIDIGGTKMVAARVDSAGTVQAQSRCSTPKSDDAQVVFGSLAEIIAEVSADAPDGFAACGVGCGGPMTVGGASVSPLNIPGWREFPLLDRLVELTGLPTEIDNDAKALALGEGWIGAAAGHRNYLAMVVSTGVGAGLVVDGRLLDGVDGNAGHLGHVVVVPDGRACVCGSAGCLEAEASGSAIAAFSGRPAKEAGPDIRARTGTLVGRAVAQAVVLLDIDLALVAGSVALGFGDPFFAAAQAELDRMARISYAGGAVIRPAGLGADGPIIGAAAVGWRHLRAHNHDPAGADPAGVGP